MSSKDATTITEAGQEKALSLLENDGLSLPCFIVESVDMDAMQIVALHNIDFRNYPIDKCVRSGDGIEVVCFADNTEIDRSKTGRRKNDQVRIGPLKIGYVLVYRFCEEGVRYVLQFDKTALAKKYWQYCTDKKYRRKTTGEYSRKRQAALCGGTRSAALFLCFGLYSSGKKRMQATFILTFPQSFKVVNAKKVTKKKTAKKKTTKKKTTKKTLKKDNKNV